MSAEYYFMREDGNRRAIRLQAVWPTTLDDMFPFISTELDLLILEDAGFGDKIGDVIWTCEAAPIVGPRVDVLFRDHNITGVRLVATSITMRSELVLPEYYGLGVTGDVIKFDYSRSEERTKKYSDIGVASTVKHGIWFHYECYPENDVIKSELGIMVSERVVKLFRKHQITGVAFIPQSEKDVDATILRTGAQ